MRKTLALIIASLYAVSLVAAPVQAASTEWTAESGTVASNVADATSTFTPVVYREISGGRLFAWIEQLTPTSQTIKVRTFSDETDTWSSAVTVAQVTGEISVFEVGHETTDKLSFLWMLKDAGEWFVYAATFTVSTQTATTPVISSNNMDGVIADETLIAPATFGFMTVHTFVGGTKQYLLYKSSANTWTSVTIPGAFTNYLVTQIVEFRDQSLGFKFADLADGETVVARYKSPVGLPAWDTEQVVPGLSASVLVAAPAGPNFFGTLIWNDSDTSEITYAHVTTTGTLTASKNNSKLFSPLSTEAAFIDSSGTTWFIGVDGSDLQIFSIDDELEIQDDAELAPTTIQNARLLDNGSGGYLAVWVETLAIKSFASGTDPNTAVKTVVSAESGTPNFAVVPLRHDNVFSMVQVNSFSNSASISTFSFVAPTAPTNVTLTRTAKTSVTATWSTSWYDAQTFAVTLKSGSDVIATAETDVFSYTFTGTSPSKSYTVVVKPTSNGVEGAAATSSALSALKAPSGVRAVSVSTKTVAGKKQLTLKWNVPSSLGGSAVKNYVVELRIGAKGAWKKVATTSSSLRSYVLKKTTKGSSYTFRITANTLLTGPAISSKTVKA